MKSLRKKNDMFQIKYFVPLFRHIQKRPSCFSLFTTKLCFSLFYNKVMFFFSTSLMHSFTPLENTYIQRNQKEKIVNIINNGMRKKKKKTGCEENLVFYYLCEVILE